MLLPLPSPSPALPLPRPCLFPPGRSTENHDVLTRLLCRTDPLGGSSSNSNLSSIGHTTSSSSSSSSSGGDEWGVSLFDAAPSAAARLAALPHVRPLATLGQFLLALLEA